MTQKYRIFMRDGYSIVSRPPGVEETIAEFVEHTKQRWGGILTDEEIRAATTVERTEPAAIAKATS